MREADVLVVVFVVVSLALGIIIVILLARLARLSADRVLESHQRKADVTMLMTERDLAVEELARTKRERVELDNSVKAQRDELAQLHAAAYERERRLGDREDHLHVDQAALDAERRRLSDERTQLDAERESLKADRAAAHERLAQVAGLSTEQARHELMDMVARESRLSAVNLARDIEESAKREADQRARSVIVTAIQRLAAEQTAESVVTTVELPSDDMKGRIIGREGRNIRSFEQVTGVNVMIDDTPGSVLISSFDPVRREIARLTLADLVADGRIHPARIEQAYERHKARVSDQIRRHGEQAIAKVGISTIDSRLVPIIGSLAYRTSYGQNVLDHLVECGRLAGLMAAELGLNPEPCVRAAFLHDIGKAVTKQADGSHAAVGAELASRYGESSEIVHAIAAHHNEVEPRTIEAVLTQAADAISGSRPGARRESLEAYVRRLERLEEIAGGYDGVQRVFAMQAGRDVRVMVAPDLVSDDQARILARDITAQVERELTYPGQIHITVVRESRATEIAR